MIDTHAHLSDEDATEVLARGTVYGTLTTPVTGVTRSDDSGETWTEVWRLRAGQV